MRLLVGLILTALNGPVGTDFANFDIAPLKDLEPTFGFLDYLDSGFLVIFFPPFAVIRPII